MRGHQVRAHSFGTLRRPGRGRGLRPGSALARWLLLLVALAGLMAMHGLSDHGVGGPVAMSSMSHDSAATGAATGAGMGVMPATATGASPGTADARHAGQHTGDAAAGSPATGVEHSAAPSGRGGGGGGGGGGDHDAMSVGMCLAVLAAALLLGVAAWRARLLGYLRDFRLDLDRSRVAILRTRSWGPAPPDLTRLSIQRC